jgi:Ca2+-binding RTX toxin-like protein
VADGGPGADIVDYSMRHDPLTVDLESAGMVQGSAGEGDSFASVEGVLGGAGDDVLRGRAGRDQINGGRGRDRIEARGGSDVIEVGDGQADTVSCGRGSDVVAGEVPGVNGVGGRAVPSRLPDASDLLAGDCESVWVRPKPSPVHLRRAGRRAAVFARPCERPGDRVSLRITAGSRTIGSTGPIRCDAAGGNVRVKLRGVRAGTVVTLHWRIGKGGAVWRTVLF